MSENCKVNGRITTNVLLSPAGSDLPWGKWTTVPTQVPANSSCFTGFYATGASGSATGTEGTVYYQAADGAKFRLYFNDPYSGSNQCTIDGASGVFTNYDFGVTFNQGDSCTADFTIKKRAS
jgi:hypothetical protein